MKKSILFLCFVLPSLALADFRLNMQNNSRTPYINDFFEIKTTPKISSNEHPIFYINNRPAITTYSLTKDAWVIPPLEPGNYELKIEGTTENGLSIRSNTVRFQIYGSN